MDNLFEQAAMITKAHGYDILAAHVKELKETIRQLIEIGELDEITFVDSADTEKFQTIVKKAKTLSL